MIADDADDGGSQARAHQPEDDGDGECGGGAHACVHHVLRDGEGRRVEDEKRDMREQQHGHRPHERGLKQSDLE